MIFENNLLAGFDENLIVHSMNKNEILNRSLCKYPLKKYAFVIGDMIHDLKMTEYAEYEE